jgi:hypothetical protein
MHRFDVVLLPGDVAINCVDADVQDLGIKRGELLAVAIERRQLLGSSGRPVQRMKTNHHVLLAAKIAEPDSDARFSLNGGKVKIRRHVSNFQRHNFSCQPHSTGSQRT